MLWTGEGVFTVLGSKQPLYLLDVPDVFISIIMCFNFKVHFLFIISCNRKAFALEVRYKYESEK